MGPRLSIRGTITCLIVGGLIPMLAFSGALVIRSTLNERDTIMRNLQDEVGVLAASLDREILVLQAPLFVLAGSAALTSGDLASFYASASDLAVRQGWTIILTDLAAQQIVNTYVPFGTPLPVAAQRHAILQVAETGLPMISDIAVGATSGRTVVTITVPVVRAGRPVYVLTMNVIDAINDVARRQAIPPGMVLAVIDRNQRVVARIPTHAGADNESAAGRTIRPETAVQIGRTAQGIFENVSQDGVVLATAFNHVGTTGWVAMMGLPRSVLFAPVWWSAWVLLTAGAGSLLLALALAAFMGRRVTRKFRVLSVLAAALGRGEAVARPPGSGIRELDALGASLIEAGSITQQRTAERETALAALRQEIADRKRLEQQLVQSQKMEAVGQLTGGIAHDFNNILGVVVGCLEFAGERVAADAVGKEAVEEGLAAAMHGAELTRRLLAFARQQPLASRPINLNDLVAGMVPLLGRTLGGRMKISVVHQANLWTAVADQALVEDALLNLTINARDAMPDGGILSIETGNVVLDEHYAADNPDIIPGDYVMLAVTDTGKGIPPEIMGRILEPFFTTKAVGKGSGLGLSIVYGFARQSSGSFRIYSELGYGTTVKLYLPRTAVGTVSDVDPVATAKGMPAGGHEAILLVEDNDALRRVVCRTLRSLGYCVHEAPDAVTALAIIDRGVPVDLLFTDVIMPGGLTGPELAAAIHTRRSCIPVVYTSGYAGTALARSAFALNGLAKPYHRQELAERIRAALNAAGGATDMSADGLAEPVLT